MSALVPTDKELAKQQATLRNIAEQVRGLTEAGDLKEVRARVEAARAWAKVHGMAKKLRLDLLAVEVEALVRMAQLGCLDGLSTSDQKAATWLSGMSPAERRDLIAKSGSATTAAGMCRSIWTADELERERRLRFQRGRQMASDPTPPKSDDEGVERARERVHGVRAALSDLVDEYASKGSPFTVADLADELISDAASEVEDEAVAQGVREVCREAVRRAPTLTLGETILPRIITARTNEGQYVRIPVENALMAHLDDMRAMRREQLRQDSEALARLDAVAEKLRAIPGCNDGSRIGALLAQTLLRSTA